MTELASHLQPPSAHLLELRRYLDTLPGGRVESPEDLIERLERCWDEFSGSHAERMSTVISLRAPPNEITGFVVHSMGQLECVTRPEFGEYHTYVPRFQLWLLRVWRKVLGSGLGILSRVPTTRSQQ